MQIAGLYLLAYLAGSVPTAYIIVRLVRNIDIRHYGSGNVGGANLAQQLGKGWLVPLVLFEVVVKGGLPIWVGRYVLGLEATSWSLLLAPLLAVAGHNWSVFLRFQGGRGITVLAGTLLFLSPAVLALAVGLVVVGWLATRSLAFWTLVSVALLPGGAYLLGEASALQWYCVLLLGMVTAKRLLSNGGPLPEGLPRRKVLINRLFRDRDLADRDQWVRRVPGPSS